MARNFASASSERIILSLGAGAAITGAATFAAIVKTASLDGTRRYVMSVGAHGGSHWALGVEATSRRVRIQHNTNGVNAATATALPADGWVLIAVSRAAGPNQTRFHSYKYAANTWVHENSGDNLPDQTPATSSHIGSRGQSVNTYDGDIAIAGAWAANLTDAQVEALAYSLPAWFAVQPNGLWLLDQAATTMKVVDLTGNGANESSIIGTTVSTGAVPVFTYGALPVQVAAGADPHPITVTLHDTGHTLTLRDRGHTTTRKENNR